MPRIVACNSITWSSNRNFWIVTEKQRSQKIYYNSFEVKYKIFIKLSWNINTRKKVKCLCYNLWVEKNQVPTRRYSFPKISKMLSPWKKYHLKILQPPKIRGVIPVYPVNLLPKGSFQSISYLGLFWLVVLNHFGDIWPHLLQMIE